MSNTKQALDGREDVIYKIADITSVKGAAFKTEHRTQKVTLLLFDGKGRKVSSLEGISTPAALRKQFDELVQGKTKHN